MKLVKIFAGLVILILILAFLTQNTNIVTVDLIFVEPKNVKVANVMLGAHLQVSINMICILFYYVSQVAKSCTSISSDHSIKGVSINGFGTQLLFRSEIIDKYTR